MILCLLAKASPGKGSSDSQPEIRHRVTSPPRLSKPTRNWPRVSIRNLEFERARVHRADTNRTSRFPRSSRAGDRGRLEVSRLHRSHPQCRRAPISHPHATMLTAQEGGRKPLERNARSLNSNTSRKRMSTPAPLLTSSIKLGPSSRIS